MLLLKLRLRAGLPVTASRATGAVTLYVLLFYAYLSVEGELTRDVAWRGVELPATGALWTISIALCFALLECLFMAIFCSMNSLYYLLQSARTYHL